MFGRAARIYRESLKPKDNFWTEVLTRPFAALLLVVLERTPITPNQVTFLSIFTAIAGAAVLVLWPGWMGLVVGALILQAAYVLDCADGQLARLTGIASPVGHLLDFLMDEIKAFVVIAAVTTRLYLQNGSVEQLLFGMWGLVVVASGISITSFLRRPEYLQTGTPPSAAIPASKTSALARRSPVGLAVGTAERFARFLIHYPSWFVYIAVFDRLDWFLYIYVPVNTLYLARSFLGIVLRLGRPDFRPRTPGSPAPGHEEQA